MNTYLRSMLLLAGLTLLTPAFADDPSPEAAKLARRIAVTTCGTCHGPEGVSQQPKFPHLAGQSAGYLSAQLKAFRSQTRGDADALAYMWGMAAPLDDDTIDALAALYAAKPAAPASHATPASLVDRGRAIYMEGKSDQGVPACSACHGPDGHGLADFPRLAGQHGQYVLKQLDSFQSNMRNVAIMHGVAAVLQAEDAAAIAAYLESLP
jgi:cytochrome c553